MPEPITVPLSSKRQQRAQLVQRLNHAIPAFGLLQAGIEAMREEHVGFGFYLGIFELLSAAVLIVLTAREFKRVARPTAHDHPPHQHHGVDWVDIAAGFMLVAEALEHWHLKHHIARPTILTAIMTFALGLSHGRIVKRVARRRILRVHDEGLLVPGHPFKGRTIDARWDEVASVEVGEKWAIIKTRSGRSRRLNLPDIHNEPQLRAALIEAQNRIRLSGGQSLPDR
jgi:hypothetical protein